MIQKKINAEFDFVSEFRDYLKFVEVKNYKNKLTLKEMNKEVEQIKIFKLVLKLSMLFVQHQDMKILIMNA